MVDKNTLRQVYLEKRLFLSSEEYLRRNTLLLHQLLNYVDFKAVSCLHTFLSIVEKNEVDTVSIIDAVKAVNPEINIGICKTLSQGELAHFILNAKTVIEKNKWGIPEPVEGEALDIGKIDLVLVPLISFDKSGHRIGYGKGFYDRFLKKIPQAQKIGLALTPPLDVIQYADELDVKLDACVTPFGVYEF